LAIKYQNNQSKIDHLKTSSYMKKKNILVSEKIEFIFFFAESIYFYTLLLIRIIKTIIFCCIVSISFHHIVSGDDFI